MFVSDVVIDMPGYVNIIVSSDDQKRSRLEGLFWMAVIGVMAGISLVGIIKVYNSTGKVTATRTVQHLPTVHMPDAAFCLPHAWNENSDLVNSIAPMVGGLNDSLTIEKRADIFDALSKHDIQRFYRENLVDCRDIMVFCKFKQQQFDCCNRSAHFRHLNQKEYMCFVIESVGAQHILGPGYGLNVLLKSRNLQNHSSVLYKFMMGYKNSVELEHFNGAMVSLARWFLEYPENKILAGPGVWTNIVFEQKYIHRVVNCQYTPPFATSHTCYESCIRHAIVSECGCLHVQNLERSKLQEELISFQLLTTHLNRSKFDLCHPCVLRSCLSAMNYTEWVAACYQSTCKHSCDETIYRTSATNSQLNLEWVSSILESRGDWNANPADFSYISIASLHLGKIFENEFHVMDPVSHVSMVGGQLGLWLGWSVITILQIIVVTVSSAGNGIFKAVKSSFRGT